MKIKMEIKNLFWRASLLTFDWQTNGEKDESDMSQRLFSMDPFRMAVNGLIGPLPKTGLANCDVKITNWFISYSHLGSKMCCLLFVVLNDCYQIQSE